MTPVAAAIIPAAGSGTRMNSAVPKQYLYLSGKPVIVHTVSVFTRCPDISQIIVVVPKELQLETERLLQEYNLLIPGIKIIAGGLRRQDSVRAGIEATGEDIDIILVHDGARPLVSGQLISRCYHEIIAKGAAIAAIEVKDTLKKGTADYTVENTIDRSSLWQAQTPQGALKHLLIRAFDAASDDTVTDESSLLENAGIAVSLVAGEETNIKITRPEDLKLAEIIMGKNRINVSIGHGFDAHRFADNRKLILAGVEIHHQWGLDGHSDADVLTHALCDAILGAMGEGDIGRHFPDSNTDFKGISSLFLLDKVIELTESRNLVVANADITVVCQTPKLSPFIIEMQRNLARCCKTNTEKINIKATTTEGMGYTGRQEGISCHAVVLLEHNGH